MTLLMPSKAPRAIALIVVLAGIVLFTIMVTAFLATVRTERATSQRYSGGANVRNLTDSVIQLVIGQIQQATRGRENGAPMVWASQPGMIRTFGRTGSAGKFYKLYSSGELIGSGDVAPDHDRPPSDWMDHPAIYTDLNEPVLNQYPILNPLAASDTHTPGLNLSDSTPVSDHNSAPMPVEWLYILENGEIAAATGKNDLAEIPSASEGNPIVGRIAYWTDDESCKVNINTACGDAYTTTPNSVSDAGSFWDTPRVNSGFEKDFLASRPPAKNEFQRYPGHPATTFLGAVFPALSRDQLAQLVPRVNGGGSEGGTVKVTTPLGLKTARLYASVDELCFAPDRSRNAPLTAEQVDLSRFVLSTSSRAPEVNLFNRPRMGIWPITLNKTTGSPAATPFDQLIAFCGTVGGKAYYLQRQRADSQTHDYLNIERNRALYSYLKALLQQEVPGYNGKFSAKYPMDYEQILTEIFDYIRCVNLGDESTGATRYTPGFASASVLERGAGQVLPLRVGNTQGFGRFPCIQEASLLFFNYEDTTGGAAAGSDAAGRTRAVLLFQMQSPSMGAVSLCETYRIKVSGLNSSMSVRSAYGPLAGQSQALDFPSSDTLLTVDCSDGEVYHGRSRGGLMGIANLFISRTGSGAMKQRRISDGSYPFASNPVSIGTAGPASGVRDLGKNFEFSGGTIEVEILPPASADNPDVAIQSYVFTFPPSNMSGESPAWPVPKLAHKLGNFDSRTTLSNLVAGPAATNYFYLVSVDDTVKSLETSHGDSRLVAAAFGIPPSFAPHYDYSTAGKYMSHSLMLGNGIPYTFGTDPSAPAGGGGIMFDIPSRPQGREFRAIGDFAMRPDYPLALQMAGKFANSPNGWSIPIGGDFDTGPGDGLDGAQINKADEGYGPAYADPYFRTDGTGIPPMGSTLFSPNRQIPSAVLFGSLPTGVKHGRPWTTLLFSPRPASGLANHPNAADPPDHLILDLFSMPVVEPYAISEPLSTAGKINLNQHILPFSYIERTTALRAVLKPLMVGAISADHVQGYKTDNYTGGTIRHPLDLEETMRGFSDENGRPRFFRSASEVCALDLVPQGQSQETLDAFWQVHRVTGDNVREKPYADLYPRVTTQSNVFTIHYRVQLLQKPLRAKVTRPQEFATEKGDTIAAEFRGSTTMERYVDPNDPAVAGLDFADASHIADPAYDLSSRYRFRILGNKRFSP